MDMLKRITKLLSNNEQSTKRELLTSNEINSINNKSKYIII